jgi:hypothetical protein
MRVYLPKVLSQFVGDGALSDTRPPIYKEHQGSAGTLFPVCKFQVHQALNAADAPDTPVAPIQPIVPVMEPCKIFFSALELSQPGREHIRPQPDAPPCACRTQFTDRHHKAGCGLQYSAASQATAFSIRQPID